MAVNNDPKFDFAQFMRDHPELRDRVFRHPFGGFFKDTETAEEMRRQADEQRRAAYTHRPPPKPDTTIRDEAYKGKVLHDVTYRRA